MNEEMVERAEEHFARLIRDQLMRVERMKADEGWKDFRNMEKIVIGIVGGDGIGPYICGHARTVLEFLLAEDIERGKVEIRDIEGMTIEDRVREMKAIPDQVVEELKRCDVILKGPTTTPKKGDPWPNIESANVAMRKVLDLFANVRPVRVPELGIDWTFFRENTEGGYMLGSDGIQVSDDLAFDFVVATHQGSERIIRMAFDYAQKHGYSRVTVVTKANVIKTTDGMFLEVAERVAKDYPGIEWDDWFIDIMTAKLIDENRRDQFQVIVLPNLYGDILTDEAAQIQGGVGTAGAANLGKRYAMFEAIHGSAPRMVNEGRAQFADPSSVIKGGALLLDHIGYSKEARSLEMALDICGQFERRLTLTGRSNGATGAEYANYIMETIQLPDLEERWRSYQGH